MQNHTTCHCPLNKIKKGISPAHPIRDYVIYEQPLRQRTTQGMSTTNWVDRVYCVFVYTWLDTWDYCISYPGDVWRGVWNFIWGICFDQAWSWSLLWSQILICVMSYDVIYIPWNLCVCVFVSSRMLLYASLGAIFMMVDIIRLHSLRSSSKRCFEVDSSWERKIWDKITTILNGEKSKNLKKTSPCTASPMRRRH